MKRGDRVQVVIWRRGPGGPNDFIRNGGEDGTVAFVFMFERHRQEILMVSVDMDHGGRAILPAENVEMIPPVDGPQLDLPLAKQRKTL